MNDFNQPNSEKIYYRELAEGVRHYKETEGGRAQKRVERETGRDAGLL